MDGSRPLRFILDSASTHHVISTDAAEKLGPLAPARTPTGVGWRLGGWRGSLTLANPLLWVLHLAFAGLAAGYLLLGATALGLPLTRSAALHLVTVGGVSCTILAMTTRVALGHTGRPLVVTSAIVLAYLLLIAAALLRSLGPALPGAYVVVIDVSALLWIVAFTLFLWVYAPILMRPRPDPPK